MADESKKGLRGDSGEMECPRCGCKSLHQREVRVYCRDKEDSKCGLAILLKNNHGATMFVSTSLEDNPSKRRDGLFIKFWCEGCDGLSGLDIYQHKGSTFVWMHPIPTDPLAVG